MFYVNRNKSVVINIIFIKMTMIMNFFNVQKKEETDTEILLVGM